LADFKGVCVDYEEVDGGMTGKGNVENLGFADRVVLVCRRRDGSVKWRYDSMEDPKSKSMAKTGMAEVAGLILADVGGTAFDYIAIGTGTTAPTADDTALENEVKRKAAVGSRITTAFTNDTAKLVTTFSSADTLSGTHNITEIGVFNASSGGVMLLRKTFTAKSVNWDDGDTLEVTATVQMVQGT